MSPPQRNYSSQQEQSPQPQQQQLQVQVQNSTQEYRQAGTAPWTAVSSVPSTPIPLYPTGAAAIIPAPPTYEVIPNRIFVGGFPTTTTETDLREHFEKFYAVKDVKMVKSLDGTSKGYGFITFDTEDQAEAIRQLTPKQLEFRNRKLNLGPAIRKINASAFPPGYAIAAPSSLVAGSPSPFSYAISPGPYGYQLSPATQMFVYPPVAEAPAEQQGTPQQSPTQQQPQQVFFGEQQEPVRTYANAVAVFPGVEKSEPPMEDRQSPAPQALQPLGNNNMMNVQYAVPQQQWYAGNNEQHQDMNNNSNSPVVYENHPEGQFYMPVMNQVPFQQYAHNGANDKNGYPTPIYLNNNGMYQGYPQMASPIAYGTHAFPQLMRAPYYHPQQFRQQNQYAGQYNNNWVGQEVHHQQHPGIYYPAPHAYQMQQHVGNDENSYPRPLQPPRAGKKSRKPSESQEKKNKSPTKGMRADKNGSPEKNQKKWNASNVSPLSSSLQSLAISSPTKN